jgi:opacity protein-like surface antigen
LAIRQAAGDNDDVFAYQLIAGVSYAIDDQWFVDGQYRFFGTQDATIQGADLLGVSVYAIVRLFMPFFGVDC